VELSGGARWLQWRRNSCTKRTLPQLTRIVHAAIMVILSLLLLVLGGCSSLQFSGQGLDAYEAQARDYLLCGMVNGRRLGLEGRPALFGHCGGERLFGGA
jgi:hypothetical protein